MDNIISNIGIKELSRIENLSVRSQNVCEHNNLDDILAILRYYRDHDNFLELRNCGHKSNAELTKICEKYGDSAISSQKPNTTHERIDPIFEKIESLTTRQKKILNNTIASQLSQLSARSLNALRGHFDLEVNIKRLKHIISDKSFDPQVLKNIGEKSEKELRSFFKDIKDQIDTILIFNNEDELKNELFNSFLTRKFNLKTSAIAKIWKDYDTPNGLPVFKTCEILIKDEVLFNKREKEVFKKAFNYDRLSKTETLNDIALNLGITRERVRQIRETIFNNFDSKFSFVKGLEFEALNLYGIDKYSDIILLSDETVLEINQNEHNSFNRLFINKVLSLLLETSHSLVGNEKNLVFKKNTRNSHRWHNTYLIKRQYVRTFDFEEFINDVSRRLSDRIDEEYSFHFETYLTGFEKENFTEHSQKIVLIAEHLLFSEFETSIDIYESIVFERNTNKQVYEYASEALEALGQPSKVKDICDKVIELHPNYKTDESSIRSSMLRKNGFVSVGRTSVYGLQNWENELESFKGGTIRSIAEDYLVLFDIPKHIVEIAQYVNKYRETNAKNILTNLKLDESNTFVFYPQSFVGLVSKRGIPGYHVYSEIPKFLGKSIMAHIRREKAISTYELKNFIQSKTTINNKAAEMIIHQLITDDYLKLEGSIITKKNES